MPLAIKGIQNHTAAADRKMRFGGLLENPYLSKGHHLLLDGGRIAGLCRVLKPYSCASVLDVGCGLGEGSAVSKGVYCGIDNSLPRVKFAARKYQRHAFLLGNARHLPFGSGTFDMAMLIDTSHHLSDEPLRAVLSELRRVSRKYVVVSDPVVTPAQNKVSAFFYSLDRGGCFRTAQQMKQILASVQGMRLVNTASYRTFPRIYSRMVFILEISQENS